MSTDATTPTGPTMTDRGSEPADGLAGRFPGLARYGWIVTFAGAVILAVGCFLSWAYVGNILGDLSIDFYPGTLQILMLVVALASVLFLLLDRGMMSGLGAWVGSAKALRALGTSAFGYMALVVIVIAVQAGGLINVNPGGWVSFLGALLMFAGSLFLTPEETKDQFRAQLPGWLEILVVAVLLALVLFGSAYALSISDAATFFLFLGFVAALAWALVAAGLFTWLTLVAQKHRRVLTLGAFMVAFLFPFTQNGSNANMSIATQVLIFATTALGLNIVVGLAGLLDLGYIAFLGAGAYTGATMSYSGFATIGWKPPFLVVMLVGGIVSATLGLIIGSPTLRVSGDYLAIVTLAFGEIFRLAMSNLDGTNGPDLTHGPNGIPAIPDLEIGSFNFGDSHVVFGITLGRFANYYFAMLVVAAIIIAIFSRLNDSRIGRGWVAIREDERAAEAMGVNVFGLKLFAFASGAFLAGLAGTIKAHQDVSVTPEQYIFLESAFLLAAVVLGGMGTVAGVLIGATILKLLPEKLRFVADYRIMFFGAMLVLMMRFRPEGLVASRRRKLEFHESDEGLADRAEEAHVEVGEGRA